ncbi:MAG: hypothetical protein ACREIS_02105 [Nitrospiraceae bacterium]
MSSVPIPQLPMYRVTLFYGPEPVEQCPSRLRCVFNVKKRSWKGGIQVVVEVEESQLTLARKAIGFDAWLTAVLAKAPQAEQGEFERRARDLFVQGVCTLKLDLALEVGIPQENSCLPGERFVRELNRAVSEQADRIRSYVSTELDLEGG